MVDWELCTLGRPARRRRPADGLLVGARRRVAGRWSSRRRSTPGFPRRDELRGATPSAPAATSRDLDFFIALGYWKLAIILEGVYARYAAGQYGKTDEGIHHFAIVVEQLANAADDGRAEGRLGLRSGAARASARARRRPRPRPVWPSG